MDMPSTDKRLLDITSRAPKGRLRKPVAGQSQTSAPELVVKTLSIKPVGAPMAMQVRQFFILYRSFSSGNLADGSYIRQAQA